MMATPRRRTTTAQQLPTTPRSLLTNQPDLLETANDINTTKLYEQFDRIHQHVESFVQTRTHQLTVDREAWTHQMNSLEQAAEQEKARLDHLHQQKHGLDAQTLTQLEELKHAHKHAQTVKRQLDTKRAERDGLLGHVEQLRGRINVLKQEQALNDRAIHQQHMQNEPELSKFEHITGMTVTANKPDVLTFAFTSVRQDNPNMACGFQVDVSSRNYQGT
jgi:chromosome segregation ATPase